MTTPEAIVTSSNSLFDDLDSKTCLHTGKHEKWHQGCRMARSSEFRHGICSFAELNP